MSCIYSVCDWSSRYHCIAIVPPEEAEGFDFSMVDVENAVVTMDDLEDDEIDPMDMDLWCDE